MKMNAKLSAMTLVFGAMASSALAEGLYVAVDAGVMSYSNTHILSSWGLDFNPGAAITIGGGYNFNKYLGVEAGFSNTSDSKITTSGFINATETLKSSATQFSVVGSIPFNDHFSLFGKLGKANTKVDYSYSSSGTSASASGTKSNTMFGIGGQYNFNKRWGLRVQYMDLGKTQVGPVMANGVAQAGTTGDIGMSLFSVGGLYNF